METPNDQPTLEAILGGSGLADATESSPGDYAVVTAENIATLHLDDCLEQLARATAEPIRLVQAAKSAHLALQAALTAALAGSMGIGAYNENDRIAWLRFLQGGDDQPRDPRMMSFPGLLARATSQPLEWSQQALQIDAAEHELLEKLTFLRHRLEHPRSGFWLVEPAYVARVLPLAARLTTELLKGLHHHFEEGELERVAATAEEIRKRCSPYLTAYSGTARGAE